MNWFRFYHEALDDPKVQRLPGDLYKAWVNLLCLASKSDARGFLPCVEDIAFALRTSTEAAQGIVDQLLRYNLLEAVDGGFTPHNWDSRQRSSDTSNERVARFRAKNQVINNGNVTSNVTPDDDVTIGNALDTDTEKKQSREETEAEQIPPTPQGSDAARLTAMPGGKKIPALEKRFEAFWTAYPRKVGKQAALKVWMRLCPNAETSDAILTAVELQKKGRAWLRDGGQYIPNPATWLGQGRWEDEVLAPESVPVRSWGGRQTTSEVVDEFRAWAQEQHDDDPNVIEAKAVTR